MDEEGWKKLNQQVLKKQFGNESMEDELHGCGMDILEAKEERIEGLKMRLDEIHKTQDVQTYEKWKICCHNEREKWRMEVLKRLYKLQKGEEVEEFLKRLEIEEKEEGEGEGEEEEGEGEKEKEV